MKNFKKLSLLGALALSTLPTISSDIKQAALFAATVTCATVGLQARASNPKDYSNRIFTEGVNPLVSGLIAAGAVGTYAGAKSSNPKVQAAAMILGVPAITHSAVSWMRQCSHSRKCIANSNSAMRNSQIATEIHKTQRKNPTVFGIVLQTYYSEKNQKA